MTSRDYSDDSELHRLAAALLESARRERASDPLQERGLRVLMRRLERSEAFRVQALRFIDVFPTLRDDAAIERHLREYFGKQGLPLPGVARWGLRSGLGGTHAVAAAVRAAVRTLARRFVGGEDAVQALQSIGELRAAGYAFTLDCLGESSVSEAEADGYQAPYLALLDELAAGVAGWEPEPLLDAVPRLNLSVKGSALCSQIDPANLDGSVEVVCRRLRPIFEAARRSGAAVCLDMEQVAYKDIVFGALRRLLLEPAFRDWPDAAVAVQADLNRRRTGPGAAFGLGEGEGYAVVGAPGEGGLLGLRDGDCRATRLAVSGVADQA